MMLNSAVPRGKLAWMCNVDLISIDPNSRMYLVLVKTAAIAEMLDQPKFAIMIFRLANARRAPVRFPPS